AYHRGIMASRTPNIDKLASEGTLLTDYYAEASCTAGRAAFITGQMPIRTGLTTVGQAGATVGMPDQAPTIATALRSMGYATGQFGKNHLGDRNEYLPTLHGFEEFYGYLYHLDAMEDPFWHSYPPELKDTVGPRNVLHCFASDADDTTVDPRWGKIGRQKVLDQGPLPPHPVDGIKLNMETVDDEILSHAIDFIDRATKDGKPFFTWLNTTRMHVITHLSEKYEKMQTPQNGWYTYEAGMAQFDDIVGSILQHLKDEGLDDNTIVVLTTDNGAEVIGWPDGGQTPFRGEKGMSTEGGFRAPCIVKWPGAIPAGTVINDIMSSQDWFPTLVAAAGDPNITQELLDGKQLDAKTYKVHLDGYNQLPMLTGKGPSARHEFFYFDEASLGAVRIDDYKYVFISQPEGWFGPKEKANFPMIFNLRLDPFERSDARNSPPSLMNFFAHEFWRFVYVQQEVGKLAKTAIDFPPMQKPASFNLEAVKAAIEEHMAAHSA
ncbi:MAG TPA: arylsulfatase, partial [Candidatus Baltobacteraceae bacterium]|nr:arylsulfatase [Candidatus Baltobacteraceae bacterium]